MLKITAKENSTPIRGFNKETGVDDLIIIDVVDDDNKEYPWFVVPLHCGWQIVGYEGTTSFTVLWGVTDCYDTDYAYAIGQYHNQDGGCVGYYTVIKVDIKDDDPDHYAAALQAINTCFDKVIAQVDDIYNVDGVIELS
jgi:hypothetical protein